MSGLSFISENMALARKLHILGAFRGNVLMSLHLGLHWHMILTVFSRHKKEQQTRANKAVALVIALIIAAYGIYAFIKRYKYEHKDGGI